MEMMTDAEIIIILINIIVWCRKVITSETLKMPSSVCLARTPMMMMMMMMTKQVMLRQDVIEITKMKMMISQR